MRVLLVGEFSGLHRYLKEGLNAIGVDAVLVSNGDGWKEIAGADYRLFYSESNMPLSKMKGYVFDAYKNAVKWSRFDIVQLINQNLYWPYANDLLVRALIRGNGRAFLLSAGYDIHVVSDLKSNKYRYTILDDNSELQELYNAKTVHGKLRVKSENRIEKWVDGIIPVSYEYYEAHKNNPKCTKIIALPINVDKIRYSDNRVDGKIVIFHGINRRADKGSDYIESACELIREKYQNDVEILIRGNLPFDDYYSIMSRANIVIDQCKSYGYGMNACIAMARGKVVMSGAEGVFLEAAGLDDCPVINIEPDVENIFAKIEYLVNNRELIFELGRRGREFVEKRHNYKEIAKEYLKVWTD